MEEIDPDDARGGHPSRKHQVLKVLLASLVLAVVGWYALSFVAG